MKTKAARKVAHRDFLKLARAVSASGFSAPAFAKRAGRVVLILDLENAGGFERTGQENC